MKTINHKPKSDPKAAPSLSDLCLIGAAEAMKYGSNHESRQVTTSDLRAIAQARRFFEGFSEQEMALALLICMVDLGRRINEREAVTGPVESGARVEGRFLKLGKR